MALDTRNKRASALGLTLAALRVGPTPDGTLGTADRLHAAYLYSGIAIVDGLNTRDKRSSVLGLGLVSLRVRPSPNGSISAADRLHATYLYSGIVVGGAPVVDAPIARRRTARYLLTRILN